MSNTTKEKISFVDLLAQHSEVRDEIEAAIAEILDTSSFIGGDAVTNFEKAFAQYLGVREVIGVGNGTDAIWIALFASGIGIGDAVITAPNTFIGTVEGITRTGAHPLFVDIDLETANLSPQALQEFLESECAVNGKGQLVHHHTGYRVAAVLPVHLYGLTAEMAPMIELCKQYGLALIEDACQAHGAMYSLNGEWRKAGSFGNAAAFSFYPAKNLGAIGDAGAVATNDPDLAAQVRMLRSHGSNEKYIHLSSHGWNARLDAIQAAVLSVKLKKLEVWNEHRRQAAAYYHELLQGLPLQLPVEPDYSKHVYHLYVIRTGEQDRLRQALSIQGIETGIHYPIPLHLQKAYTWMGYHPGSFPNAELSAKTILSLPMHPFLEREQIIQVSQVCADAFH